ncbi:MAG TPA: Hsp70 family protein [Caulobacteraceae bacterium]|nr:Hsp70 family protein [Caulobacteraceae bacterium]
MYLGIDLGTSNSAIVGATGTTLRLFKSLDGADVLPSVLFIDARGRRFVGRRAYEQATLNPDNVASGVKRLMGTSTPLKFAAAGISLTPEEASAEILRTLVAQVQAEVGSQPIEASVVTIPAAFNQMQTEATIASAEMAGLRPVGLLHEPIAAALASMAGAKIRSGQFLVYDLGGGTFDAALVQASAGVVNVVAHEGVNMLGGRDFDNALLQGMVAPWLEGHFDLDPDYRLDPKFDRLLRRLRLKVEEAKIELSVRDRAPVFLAGEEAQITDRRGTPIYIDIELSRGDLEGLVSERIERSIEICRKLISDNGYDISDIDRVVLIGGPSKMPLVRQRAPEELGISADLSTDPMTAVATGAAIYAESRDWGGAQTVRKSSRASTISADELVRFEYPSRTADDHARLRMVALDPHADARLRITGEDGWTSGDIPLTGEQRVELPLPRLGESTFKVTVTVAGVGSSENPLTITRTFASSAGVPATHTLGVAVEQDVGGARREVVVPIINKGTVLPAKGREQFRAARALVGGTDGQIDLAVYEMAEGVDDPSLCQLVGSFQLKAVDHLERGETLRAGDPIIVNWDMDDNGLLKCTLELPHQQKSFDTGRFFSPIVGHRNFADEDGRLLATAVVKQARESLDEAKSSLSNDAWFEMGELQQRLEAQEQALESNSDAETRRQAAEEARSVRQAVARLSGAPQNRAAVMTRELASVEEGFDELVRESAGESECARFDQLSTNARRFVDNGQFAEASTCLSQMRGLFYQELLNQPGFLVAQFQDLASERYLAVDKGVHDKLVEMGQKCLREDDWQSLRRVNGELISNRVITGPSEKDTTRLVGLMKAH